MLKVGDIINGEKIKLIVKKHYILNIFLGIFVVFCLVISVVLTYLYTNKILTYFGLIIFWQVIFFILYFNLIGKELDILIITESKIIIVNKKSFFENQYKELNFNQIKEIKAISKGLFGGVFNYGELNILTKDQKESFTLKYIPNVINIAKEIDFLSKG